MSYELALDMGVVDYAIQAAIRELSDGQRPLTAEEIAAHIECSAITVRRNLPRLIEANKITRYGSKRNGYWYEVSEAKGVKRHARCG